MRRLATLSLLLVPAALVAQAPATPAPNLTERFNAELPGINALLNEFKAKEAVAKAEAMIPAQPPAFDGSNPSAIFSGLDNGRAFSMMHHALANALGVLGEWEKGKVVQEKRLAYTKMLQVSVLKGIQPIEEQWKKVTENARNYIAKNEPRKAELEAKLKAIQDEFTEVKAGKKKLTKEQLADLNARGKVAQQEDEELQTIASALLLERDNIQKEQKIRPILENLKKDTETVVLNAQEALAKIQKTIAQQAEEIQKFNDEQNEKAKKVKAKKTFSGSNEWVEAVMRGKESIMKLPKPQDQIALLNRLHVLVPANKDVAAAIENIQAGKGPFEKTKQPAKTKKTK